MRSLRGRPFVIRTNAVGLRNLVPGKPKPHESRAFVEAEERWAEAQAGGADAYIAAGAVTDGRASIKRP
jgi:hypothetical protein